ncbi:MAG TPA: dihydrodipicolinate synthase family protein [Caldilineaceae bacterium]|nr:dihydrodipicolinate synthase family protein [Caldilineaceae bacterium]
MSTTKRPIRGVLPVFQTPYHPDYAIDFTTLEREIQWLFAQGADGIVMGMVSETLRLSGDERKAVAEAVCRYTRTHGNGESVAIISAGAESTHTAVDYARHAEQVGADGVMVIPPVSVAVGEEELYRYYATIIEAINIPVVVQDASGYVGRPMSIAMQAALYNTYGDRVLFKPEATPIGPRLSALRDATDGRAPILEGTGGIALVDSYRRGIVGTMPGADLIDVIVALWQALEADDEELIYQLSLPLSSLIAIQNSLDAFLAVEKYLLVQRGIFQNELVRGPVGYTLDPETRAEIDRLFAQLQQKIRS